MKTLQRKRIFKLFQSENIWPFKFEGTDGENYLLILLFPWNFGGDIFHRVDSAWQPIPCAAAVHFLVVFLLLIS
jgi:hypothetical protein